MKNRKKRSVALALLAILGLLVGVGAVASKTSAAQPPAQHSVAGDFKPPVGG